MVIIGDGVFAYVEKRTIDFLSSARDNRRSFTLSDGVPQFNCLVSAATHDLTIVGREGHAEHVFLVANELSRACADGQIPQAQ